MKLPRKIKVGGYWFKIEKGYKFRDKDNLLGQANFNQLKIRMEDKDRDGKKLSSEREMELLVREILHCVDYVYNGQRVKETSISCMAHGLYQVLKDNHLRF